MMTQDELDTMLDRYGGDFRRWPEALRRSAEALVASDPEAARRLAETSRLDALLAEAVEPEPADAALIGRIVAGARGATRAEPSDVPLRARPRLFALAGTALTACLAAGFFIGNATPSDEGDTEIARLLFQDTAILSLGDTP